jgi:hypothetical protein
MSGNSETAPSDSGALPPKSIDAFFGRLLLPIEAVGSQFGAWFAGALAVGEAVTDQETPESPQTAAADRAGPAAERMGDDVRTDDSGDANVPDLSGPTAAVVQDVDDLDDVDIRGLRGRISDLLTSFPLSMSSLDAFAEPPVDAAGRLLHQAKELPLSFWLSLISTAAAAYEIARREMTRLPHAHVPPPDAGPPTDV